jgi:hypothetical protein
MDGVLTMQNLFNFMPGEWEATGQSPTGWQGRMGGLLSGDDPLLNIGLGILANNNSRNLSQVLGRGVQQGLQQTQQAKAFGLQTKRQQAQDKRLDREDAEYQRKRDAMEAFKVKNPQYADIADIDPSIAIKAANPNLSANSADPYTSIVYDAQGNGYLQNHRETDPSKALTPISIGGKPFTGAKYSPELAGSIKQAEAGGSAAYKVNTDIPGMVMTDKQVAEQANPALSSPIPANVPRLPNAQTSMVVPPALQKQRDDVRLKILLAEQQADGGQGKNPELDQEIARMTGSRVLGGGIAVPTPDQQAALTEAAKARAENTVKAQSGLPNVIQESQNTIGLIDDLLKAPGLEQAVGASRWLGMQKIPGTSARDFDIRLEQLKGKQFLQAYESLKGAGAITDIEGTKAGNAIARMDASASEEEFKKAAREFQSIIKQGVERAKAKAGDSTASGATRVRRYNPKTGRIE